jgi:hypothetical protein
MESTLEAITKRLKKLDLVLNVSKTEVCLFYKNDTVSVKIQFDNQQMLTKKVINVLGVTFDSKLTWAVQVDIHKANKALNTIKFIQKYFSTKKLVHILTSNFYSILL